MRRVLLLLILVALVPLRTWAGDAMAIRMAAQTTHGSSLAAVADTAPAHAECHGMQAEPAALASPTAQDHCETCAFCQACFTVAIALPAMPPATLTLPHNLPHTASVQFTSAVLALGHKPPIS